MPHPFSFHAGEQAVQAMACEAGIAERNATVISETILGGARPFIEKQFMVVLSSVDGSGAVWSSVIYGKPGFASVAGDSLVSLHVPQQTRDLSDPFWTNIQQQSAIGMLFIELGSRRRYRINGQVESDHNDHLHIVEQEAYPNCPKYIQKRHLSALGESVAQHEVLSGKSISADIAGLIRSADTLFVASLHAQTGADASHRGGEPGFVHVVDAQTLRIPDFSGNSLFNTLGNIETNPHAGICIPDFEGQQLLQLSGQARILWDQPDPENLTGGTQRFWEFTVSHWLLRRTPQHLQWEFLDASPFNPPASGD